MSKLTRTCHVSGEDLTGKVAYTRVVHDKKGHTRRVYVSPTVYWEQLSEQEREDYQREVPATKPRTDGRSNVVEADEPEASPDPRKARKARKAGKARLSRKAKRAAKAEPAVDTRPRRRPASDVVIVAKGLAKTYPDGTRAVKGVDFQVRKGEIFGMLGPNGAGKSTTIGMLGTLVFPTGGHGFVGGFDVVDEPDRIKPILGFAMQDVGVDELATGREFLLLQSRLYGLDKETARRRAEELLALVGLEDEGRKRIERYSGGMKRKIDLASALIHEPEIIFLDEPTEGLDPRARQDLWDLLLDLRERLGTTILLSTHYMEEADHLCDRLAIIDQGRIVAEGTPEELKARVGRQSIVLMYEATTQADKLAAAERLLLDQGVGEGVHRTRTELHVYIRDAASATPRILHILDEVGLAPDTLNIKKASLDDVYLATTGRSLEEADDKADDGAAAATPGVAR